MLYYVIPLRHDANFARFLCERAFISARFGERISFCRVAYCMCKRSICYLNSVCLFVYPSVTLVPCENDLFHNDHQAFAPADGAIIIRLEARLQPNIGFIYGALWRWSRVRLYLRQK